MIIKIIKTEKTDSKLWLFSNFLITVYNNSTFKLSTCSNLLYLEMASVFFFTWSIVVDNVDRGWKRRKLTNTCLTSLQTVFQIIPIHRGWGLWARPGLQLSCLRSQKLKFSIYYFQSVHDFLNNLLKISMSLRAQNSSIKLMLDDLYLRQTQIQ